MSLTKKMEIGPCYRTGPPVESGELLRYHPFEVIVNGIVNKKREVVYPRATQIQKRIIESELYAIKLKRDKNVSS